MRCKSVCVPPGGCGVTRTAAGSTDTGESAFSPAGARLALYAVLSATHWSLAAF